MSVPARRLVAFSLALALIPGAAAAHAAEEPSCRIDSTLPAAPVRRPHYSLRINVSRGLRLVTGSLTVTFTAPDNAGTDRMVFRLWPNGPLYAKAGARLSISRIREGSASLAVSAPNPTTRVVSRAIAPGEAVTVSMNWRLRLPRRAGLRIKGGGRSVRLGSFFPLLAWSGSDWALDPPTKLPAAEAWTTPVADFDVRITRPPRLRVLASGQEVGPGRWRAQAVRDFSLAVGRFAVVRGTAMVPGHVAVTVASESLTSGASRRALLRSAITSLERYSSLYGPYPWPTFTVVAMDDSDGLEYPTLVYQPPETVDAAHETAHQWFYSLVGNDQARDPWLDEGLATWAEAAVNGAPPFADAEIPAEVADRIGEPMSFWDRFEMGRYFLGVYLQTYRALLELGPRSEVDCALRLYVLHNAYETAQPDDLLRALQTFFPDARAKLEAHGAHF